MSTSFSTFYWGADDPDLIVVTHASLDEVITGATVSHWNHGGWGWYGGWCGINLPTARTRAGHDLKTRVAYASPRDLSILQLTTRIFSGRWTGGPIRKLLAIQ